MPETSRMFTEKYETYQCTLMVRERFLQKTQREHGYDGNTMKLIVTGGGGCLLSNFGKAPASVVKAKRIIRQYDICAAAKGYEYLAELQLRAGK